MDRPRLFLEWAVKMFGPVAMDHDERLARFVEEAVELAHAGFMSADKLQAIVQRVYSRPAGTIRKEVGQSQATLECYAECMGLSAEQEAEREWQRVQEIPQDEWQRRHAAKVALGIAG